MIYVYEQIWRRIPDWPNYEMSNFGFVFNTLTGIALKNRTDTEGYASVTLCRGRKNSSNKRIHRIVASLFISNDLNLPVINHLDGIKTNNQVINLEWCTQKTNIRHSWSIGMSTARRGKESSLSKNVQCLATGRIISITEASLELSVNRKSLTNMLNGHRPNWTYFVKI